MSSSTASTCLPSAEEASAHAASLTQASERNGAMADDASVTRICAVALTLAGATSSVIFATGTLTRSARADL